MECQRDSGDPCIPSSWICDELDDCLDGRDEQGCVQVEDALGRRWGSCSYNCTSIYGNASCIPDAFSCDGGADCMEEEDEQGCEGVVPTTVDDCPTFYCGLPGSPDLTYCVHSHLICDGYPDCAAGEDEQGCGNADGVSTQASTTMTIGLTAEPTSGQGSFEDQTGLYTENHGSKDQAVIWITAAALGGQILYRLAF
ncbi:low-density lipoprotein receptor-like isoform X2 [Branchiostoma lanceolatum]|uniref:low-density lipoprotein receptor-like isoform X2 n=1 Tax=Branchiostoma lanceolatum TaxID=7740 RepID=UPI003455669D